MLGGGGGGGSVANALFHVMKALGIIFIIPLDHSVLVRGDILTLRFPWGHVGLRVADMITVDITCSGRAL